MKTLKCIPVSPGQAIGKPYFHVDILEKTQKVYSISKGKIPSELHKIKQTFKEVIADLDLCASRMESTAKKNLALIFRAHQEILKSESLITEITKMLETEKLNAEYIVNSVLKKWENKFRSLEGSQFREKADDIKDLSRRILRKLAGVSGHSLEKLPKGRILITRRLLPSEVLYLPKNSVKGIVVRYGGTGSHVALLSRAMGIPAVIYPPENKQKIPDKKNLILNGSLGRIIINPYASLIAKTRKTILLNSSMLKKSKLNAKEKALTKNNVHIPVFANIINKDDVFYAREFGADGIGLYRTETMYLNRKTLPTANEIVNELSKVLKPFKGKFICLRLLDVGGDKNLPCLSMTRENNPFLGRRGIRLLKEIPVLLKIQLLAFLRLSKSYKINILIPMVTVIEDILFVKDILADLSKKTKISPPSLGAMIETPAAALITKDICEHVEFISIGTNDLTQYIMAADRESQLVHQYYNDRHKAVKKMIQMICTQAQGKLIGVCGELASKPEATTSLLKSGVKVLSVVPPMIPKIKETIRSIKL